MPFHENIYYIIKIAQLFCCGDGDRAMATIIQYERAINSAVKRRFQHGMVVTLLHRYLPEVIIFPCEVHKSSGGAPIIPWSVVVAIVVPRTFQTKTTMATELSYVYIQLKLIIIVVIIAGT